MEPTFPSAKDLQAILNTLKQQTVAEEEAVQKFLQTYWESSDDDRQRAADHQRAAAQAVQEAQTSRHQLIEHLATYEETMGGGVFLPCGFLPLPGAPSPPCCSSG